MNGLPLTRAGFDYVLALINGMPVHKRPVNIVFGAAVWLEGELRQTIANPVLTMAMDQQSGVSLSQLPVSLSELGIQFDTGDYLAVFQLPAMKFIPGQVVRYQLTQTAGIGEPLPIPPQPVSDTQTTAISSNPDGYTPDGTQAQAPAAPITVSKPMVKPPVADVSDYIREPREPYATISPQIPAIATTSVIRHRIGVGLPMTKLEPAVNPGFGLNIYHYTRL